VNRDDVVKLLAIASAFDNRKPNEAQAIAWAEVLTGLDPRDCAEAIKEHYKESREYLMPAHVVSRARTFMLRRREEEQVAEHLAIMGRHPENVDRVKAIEAGANDIGNEPYKSSKGDRALPCKWCGAKPGQPCTTPGTQRRLTFVHPSRLEAVEAAS
jgi:hypothetical protein